MLALNSRIYGLFRCRVQSNFGKNILCDLYDDKCINLRAFIIGQKLNHRHLEKPSSSPAKLVQQRFNYFLYLLFGKLPRMPVNDLSLLVNHKRIGNRIDIIAQLMSQGEAVFAAQ